MDEKNERLFIIRLYQSLDCYSTLVTREPRFVFQPKMYSTIKATYTFL